MSYQYNTILPSATPVVLTNEELSTITTCTFHTIEISGSSTIIELKIANNADYVTITSIADDIENINAIGITSLRLTSSGGASMSIAGIKQ